MAHTPMVPSSRVRICIDSGRLRAERENDSRLMIVYRCVPNTWKQMAASSGENVVTACVRTCMVWTMRKGEGQARPRAGQGRATHDYGQARPGALHTPGRGGCSC
jgi:hypothetical protein